MMICPQTKAECNMMRCHDNESCAFPPSDSVCLAAPPKPTMAEIEQLVDEDELCVLTAYVSKQQGTNEANAEAKTAYLTARAALLAAIRPYVEGK